jgi:predicted O-methyltransferase YrrM
MNNFNKVTSSFDNLPYMQQAQAKLMRDMIRKHDARDILEIGFYHGKSSAYFAAILEDLGAGHLVTMDMAAAKNRDPNIEAVLSSLDLGHRVTTVYAHRSYTWELAKMLQVSPRPQFDLCYLDGGHTWDCTGFGFVLVDMFLRPGGWIVFDDLRWTIEAAIKDRTAKMSRYWQACSADERATPAIQLVFDTIVPHLGYTDLHTANEGRWGIARKPLERQTEVPGKRSVMSRVMSAVTGR